jgi:hypothetical protein
MWARGPSSGAPTDAVSPGGVIVRAVERARIASGCPMARRFQENWDSSLLRQNLPNAPNLCAHAAQLFFDVFVATVNVVDTVDDCLALGHQRG